MDLTTTGSTPTNTNTTDTENETPPAISTIDQPIKSLTFTNGALKKHSLHHHHHRLYPQPPSAVYKECLKNHAASMGGHALDGCGEFMPSPASNPTDPTSLKCAACGCHRNFHRRREEEPNTISFHLPLPPPPPRRGSPLSSPSPPPQPQSAYYSSAPAHMLLALSTAVREEQHNHAVATPETPTAAKAENPSGRKRFRTKFSREQKEKMFLFSEKIGWKMQKSDQGSIEEFCNKIGVSKGVLKVWMHNNKNTFAKKDVNSAINSNNFSNFDGKVVLKFEKNGHSNGGHIHVSANGSASSA